MSLIDSAQKINDAMPEYVARHIKRMNLASESSILVVGLAYKPGVSDLRESPSLELLTHLKSQFTKIDWWDERIKSWKGELRSELKKEFDLIVLTHKVKDKEVLNAISKAKHVIDCTGQFRGQANVQVF